MESVQGRERERGKKRMLLKVAIKSVAFGYSWLVPGVVNSGRWSTEAAIEADSVSQMLFFHSVLFLLRFWRMAGPLWRTRQPGEAVFLPWADPQIGLAEAKQFLFSLLCL